MTMKKSYAAVAVALGLTMTAAGASASSGPDDAAEAKADSAMIQAHHAMKAADSAADGARVDDGARKCRKKRASKREVKHLRVYMSYKKARKKLDSKGRKVGSKNLRAWNTCFDRYSDLYLHMDKRKGRRYVYSIDAPILG